MTAIFPDLQQEENSDWIDYKSTYAIFAIEPQIENIKKIEPTATQTYVRTTLLFNLFVLLANVIVVKLYKNLMKCWFSFK